MISGWREIEDRCRCFPCLSGCELRRQGASPIPNTREKLIQPLSKRQEDQDWKTLLVRKRAKRERRALCGVRKPSSPAPLIVLPRIGRNPALVSTKTRGCYMFSTHFQALQRSAKTTAEDICSSGKQRASNRGGTRHASLLGHLNFGPKILDGQSGIHYVRTLRKSTIRYHPR